MQPSSSGEEPGLQHTSIDAFHCDSLVTRSSEAVGDFSQEVCKAIRAKPLSNPVVESFGGPVDARDHRIYGPSSYQMTREGIVVCHFPQFRFRDTGLVCIDVEHEGAFDNAALADLTKNFFAPDRLQLMSVVRGRSNTQPKILAVSDSERSKMRWVLEKYDYVDTNAPGRSVTMEHLLRSFDPEHDWGQVTIADLHGCDAGKIQDDDHLRTTIVETCKHVGAKPYGEARTITTVADEAGAVRKQVYQLIETSGISMRVVPTRCTVLATAFSCKAFDSKNLLQKLQELLIPQSYVTQTLLRGATDKFPKVYHSTNSANLKERWEIVPE